MSEDWKIREQERAAAGLPAVVAARHINQPPPIRNDSTPIVDFVMEDLVERKRIGTERYGTPLQAHNGRDMLRDAYEEALDLCIYLRGAIAERDG